MSSVSVEFDFNPSLNDVAPDSSMTLSVELEFSNGGLFVS